MKKQTNIVFNGNAGGVAYSIPMHEVVTSEADGAFTFHNLVDGAEYYVMELAAPTDYGIHPSIYKVKAVATGEGGLVLKSMGQKIWSSRIT